MVGCGRVLISEANVLKAMFAGTAGSHDKTTAKCKIKLVANCDAYGSTLKLQTSYKLRVDVFYGVYGD
ncbi:hypothetical protein V6N13_122734 [Hibiscus sabdariffa]